MVPERNGITKASPQPPNSNASAPHLAMETVLRPSLLSLLERAFEREDESSSSAQQVGFANGLGDGYEGSFPVLNPGGGMQEVVPRGGDDFLAPYGNFVGNPPTANGGGWQPRPRMLVLDSLVPEGTTNPAAAARNQSLSDILDELADFFQDKDVDGQDMDLW